MAKEKKFWSVWHGLVGFLLIAAVLLAVRVAWSPYTPKPSLSVGGVEITLQK